MDGVDRRIVEQLQRDGSLSSAELAKTVGASPASTWRRIKALEAAGVLGRTVRLVDAEAVGRGVNVLCSIRIRSHAAEHRNAFEQFIDGRPEVMECYSMSGDWDYLLRIVAADVADYNRFLMSTLLPHPSVAAGSSRFVLAVTKYTTVLPL
ncbi:Lrp/AsnC family transcriptional regulator [uncultured Sphingomonas sp.]|uniref:Lrp/AsnC family transcriptional regulator n=1 Tax=uncultured Sphingomonas sp. TaxID=158754 RepID=UPI0035CB46E9